MKHTQREKQQAKRTLHHQLQMSQVRRGDQPRYPHLLWPLRWTIAHSKRMVPLLRRKKIWWQGILPLRTHTHTHFNTPRGGLVHSCTSPKRGAKRQVDCFISDCKTNNERITDRAIGPCKATAQHTTQNGSVDRTVLRRYVEVISLDIRICCGRFVGPSHTANGWPRAPLHELKSGPRVHIRPRRGYFSSEDPLSTTDH